MGGCGDAEGIAGDEHEHVARSRCLQLHEAVLAVHLNNAEDILIEAGRTIDVTHGERDSQIPLKWAHRTYEQLVNSPKRELKVFTDREGGSQHASFDNSINAGQYIADWVAETLGGRTAG